MVLDRQDILAVDAALLLSAEAADRVRRLNELMYAERSDGFVFGPTRVPHITLAQLYVRRTNLLDAIRRLDAVFREVRPLELSVARLVGRDQVVSLRIRRTAELMHLHAAIMDQMKSIAETEGSVEAFYGAGDKARETDVTYVAAFRKRASYSRYIPHVTLGYGQPPVPDVFMDFECGEAGLFRLGRFCTCRQFTQRR
jgi:2'-5' RNA ligase